MTDKEFEIQFDNMMRRRRDEMREKYNRVLPSGEYLFNRFDKAPYLNCGEGSSIYDSSVVMGDVIVGDKVWIGPYTLLDGSAAELRIGNFVSIDSGVMIYTHDSTKHYVSGGIEPFQKGKVTIGDCTVIGTSTMVGCNVSIGNHCVVGANSFVNKDVPDNTIVAGIPARKIGYVVVAEDGAVEFIYE